MQLAGRLKISHVTCSMGLNDTVTKQSRVVSLLQKQQQLLNMAEFESFHIWLHEPVNLLEILEVHKQQHSISYI